METKEVMKTVVLNNVTIARQTRKQKEKSTV